MARSIDGEIRRILREEAALEDALTPPRPPSLRRHERGIRTELKTWLRQSGLNRKALQTLEAAHLRERSRGAERIKRLVARQGAALHKRVVKDANVLRAMATPVTGPVPGGLLLVVLDQPRSIIASPNAAVLTDSRISPGDNFAKMRVDRGNRGRDRVAFIFMWQNPTDQPVIVDAAATMSVNGFIQLHVNNGLLGNVGSIDVSTRMSVRRFPLPFARVSGPTRIASVLAFNYPWWTAQDASAGASAAVDHSVREFTLAPRARMMISVSMTVFSDFDDGRGVSDFDLGLFGIGVPQVTLTVRSATFVVKA